MISKNPYLDFHAKYAVNCINLWKDIKFIKSKSIQLNNNQNNNNKLIKSLKIINNNK